MKNIGRYMVLSMLSLAQVACSDFLKEDSGDLLIPKKVDEFAPVLYGEGYPSSLNDDLAWFGLMTDDIEMGPLELDPKADGAEDRDDNIFNSLDGGEGRQAYVWHYNIEDKIMDDFWAKRYDNILACNIVIDALPGMEYVEADSGKYNYLAAQAYALRAYHYWCLANTYAAPYAEANLDKPGVIIRLDPQIDIAPHRRSSVRETWQQINEDIKVAERYIEVSEISGNKHLLTKPAIYFLASRIALFQENWEEVIRTGNLFWELNNTVFDLNSVERSTMGTDKTDGFTMMDGSLNGEIVFTFGTSASSYSYDYLCTPSGGTFYGLGFRASYSDENSLIQSYEEGDLRKLAWFLQDIPAEEEEFWGQIFYTPAEYFYNYPIKYRKMGTGEGPNAKLYRENWRSTEVILNMAEAYARRDDGVSQDAINWLNRLRKGRIETAKYVDKVISDFSGKEDLVKFIWAERRRELCFEEAMRFWDLRRQGMPQLVHKWYSSATMYETYVLRQGSPNYVLAIPDSEINYNDLCTDNPREVINNQ